MKKKLYINLVNYEQALGIDAILSKYTRMLERELIDLGYKVTVSDKPKKKADVNHHINYISYVPSGGLDTTMITHLTGDKNQTEEDKVNLVKNQLKTSSGICFNEEIREKLIKHGCKPNKLFVSGHAHDGVPRRPKLIAMCFNLYPDGRKREHMIAELFRTFKDPSDFMFRVIGKGWKEFLTPFTEAGIQAQGSDGFDPDFYNQVLCTSDFMLYTGDEDSLGQAIIDAKQAGLRVIAPPQRDLTVDYPFTSQEELNAIFESFGENEVADWTWENFAKKHADVWEKLYAKKGK